MRSFIEQILNIVWFLGVWAFYILLCHLVAKWGERLALSYRKVFLFSIPFLGYTFLWVLFRNYRIRKMMK